MQKAVNSIGQLKQKSLVEDQQRIVYEIYRKAGCYKEKLH